MTNEVPTRDELIAQCIAAGKTLYEHGYASGAAGKR